jgi:hypothetical protein
MASPLYISEIDLLLPANTKLKNSRSEFLECGIEHIAL